MIIIFIILYCGLFLVGVQYIKKNKFNDKEQRHLADNIFKQNSTSKTISYFVGIVEFLTNIITLIYQSFRFMMKQYYVESIESTIANNLNIEMISNGFSSLVERSDTDSFDKTNTENITFNNDLVLSSINGKSQRLLLLTHFYNFII